MRLIEKSNDTVLRVRLKKHLLNAKQRRERKQKRKNLDQSKGLVLVKGMPLLDDFLERNQSCEKHDPYNSLAIKTPKNFNIFENPCSVLSFLASFVDFALKSKSRKIVVNHSKTKKYSLGSEVLLGLLAGEVKRARSLTDRPLEFSGLVKSNNVEHQLLLAEVGIISELDNAVLATGVEPNAQIHVYKKDCTINESVSSTGDDMKNLTASDFVNHIKTALRDHNLKLSDDAGDSIKGCLGEILDNVNEHSGKTSPTWSVRGYINNNGKNRDLELVVMNMGQSIAETFDRLPDDNHSKQIVDGYASHHRRGKKGSLFTQEQLYTVAALQGRVSSKNNQDEDTRGQGTITLIETFEKIYKAYQALREPKGSDCATMNLLSGHVVVKFDGTYMSKITQTRDGGERVTISFNKSGSLRDSPDPAYLCRMKSFFPGLMINIKIPLRGSITPIGE
ncbi:hypothetical protein [Shewanella xiamenensis]|uniref:hypothetical protein n=1 Tax=Shewanella xiamenensis TaxID=332186 RepID=UPI001CC675FF|nr:hypothetical protein [Shewanella xiamenensis]BDA59743.1 hypothetical protein NUITMVS1_12060 [Shewanella xiamenensis]